MSTSNYRDSTTYVSSANKANDYTQLGNYSQTGNSQAAPLSSVLKLSNAPGTTKYFTVDPRFQARLDNFRIAPPAMTPIGITSVMVAPTAPPDMSSIEYVNNNANSGDYYTLAQGAYSMNSM